MTKCFMLGALLIVVEAFQVRADILPPAHKWVGSSARFENLAQHPDYAFFISYHPKAVSYHLAREKGKGQPFPLEAVRLDADKPTVGLSGNPADGPKYLLAVPKSLLADGDVKPMSTWFDGQTPGILQRNISYGIRSVSQSESRDHFWVVYTVDIAENADKKGKELRLNVVSQDVPSDGSRHEGESPAALPEDGSQRWYVAGGFAAAALVLLLGWLVLRRRG